MTHKLLHVRQFADPEIDPKGAAKQKEIIVRRPALVPRKMDIINWQGSDEPAIIKRGVAIASIQQFFQHIRDHCRTVGLDEVLEMGMHKGIYPSGNTRHIDCFDLTPGLRENILGIVDQRGEREDDILFWQETVNLNGSPETVVASGYLQELLEVCSTSEPIRRVRYKLSTLPEEQRGGASFAYYLTQCLINIDKSIIDQMDSYFETIIAEKGLAEVEGENVRNFSRLIYTNASFLDLADRDLDEVLYQSATGLAKCTCNDLFAKTFDNMAIDLQRLDFSSVQTVCDVPVNRMSYLEVLRAMLDHADGLYDLLQRKNKWNLSPRRNPRAYHIDSANSSNDRVFTKSGLKLRRYSTEEWKKLTEQERSEIAKAHKNTGLRHTWAEVEVFRKQGKGGGRQRNRSKNGGNSNGDSNSNGNSNSNRNSNRTKSDGANVVVFAGKGAYGKCDHCGGLADHTTGQHAAAMVCRQAGTVYKPGKNSLLAKAIKKHGQGPPIETDASTADVPAPPPSSGQPPPPSSGQTPPSQPPPPTNPTPSANTIQIDADVLRERLRHHETMSSDVHAAVQADYVRNLFSNWNLN